MNIKYVLLITIIIAILILCVNVYFLVTEDENKTRRKVTLRRKNAMTEEEIEKILREQKEVTVNKGED